MQDVFISIGSNMGDRLANCRKGLERIGRMETSPNSGVIAAAPFYETDPVDYENQGKFINCAAMIETELEAAELLHELKKIEREAGTADKRIRFGPRILDLDIIFYSDLIVDSEPLTIPHPRMHLRNFVLTPLADIAPDFVHPVLKIRVRDLLDNLQEKLKGDFGRNGQKVVRMKSC